MGHLEIKIERYRERDIQRKRYTEKERYRETEKQRNRARETGYKDGLVAEINPMLGSYDDKGHCTIL